MKRLSLFVFFDKDGYVAKYIEHIVKELKDNSQHLVVICNGFLSAKGRKLFEKYTNDIIVRENFGFEATAWKETLVQFIGWQAIRDYDEILFMNDICYGPIYPLSTVLEKMDEKPDLDFWGITRHYTTTDFTQHHKDGVLPEHIQTYFIVVRKKMLCSPEFRMFWENMPPINNYYDDIGSFETSFTKFFQDRGFTWDTYVNMSEYQGRGYDNFCANYELPYTLMSKNDMPFLRRKSLTQTIENSCAGPEKDAKRAIDYIMHSTSYDVSMIWEDLLRKNNIADLYSRLHLDFVLPRNGVIYPPAEQHRIALLMHVYYQDQIPYCLDYAKNIPDYTDVYVTTTEQNIPAVKEAFNHLRCNKLDIRAVQNRGRDMAALFVGCKDVLEFGDYELICCIHDKKSPQVGVLRGMAFRDITFESVLSTKDYVKNIIGLFEREPFLGYAAFPIMIGHPYWHVLEDTWASPNNFNITMDVLEKCDVHVPVSKDKQPIVYANVFWCRPNALKPLIDLGLDYSDFSPEPMGVDGTFSHGLERAVTYVAQSQGYFSAALYTDEYASIYIPALMLYCRRRANDVKLCQMGLPLSQSGAATGSPETIRARTHLKNAAKSLLYPHKRSYAFVKKVWKKLRRCQ